MITRILDEKNIFSGNDLGTQMTLTNPKTLTFKKIGSTAIEALSAILLSTKAFISIVPTVLIMVLTYGFIDCSKEVRYIAPNEQNIVYLDVLSENTDKVFLKTSEKIDISQEINKIEKIPTVEEIEKKPIFKREPLKIVTKTLEMGSIET